MSLNQVPVVSLLMVFFVFLKQSKLILQQNSQESLAHKKRTLEVRAWGHCRVHGVCARQFLNQKFDDNVVRVYPVIFIHSVIFHVSRLCNSRVTSDKGWVSDTDCHCSFSVHSHLLSTMVKFTLVRALLSASVTSGLA